jgi:hypothetical protein
VSVLPTLFVVGRDGKVREVVVGGGPQAVAQLRAAVEGALADEG